MFKTQEELISEYYGTQYELQVLENEREALLGLYKNSLTSLDVKKSDNLKEKIELISTNLVKDLGLLNAKIKLRKQQLVTPKINLSKSASTAIILMDGKGKIAFLKRAGTDDFHPLTWCLPGGGVDEEENPFIGAIRETKEETQLTLKRIPTLSKVIQLKDKNLFYFIYDISEIEKEELVIDNKEHYDLRFFTVSEWLEQNLILDLKEHLKDIFNVGNSLFPGIITAFNNLFSKKQKEDTTLEENLLIIKKGIEMGLIDSKILKNLNTNA